MKEKFIPGTKKKYSITSEGIVYSHYRYNFTGKRSYKRKIVSKHLSNGSAVFNLQLNKPHNQRQKTVSINSLMKDVFNLKLPDVFHMYALKNKDGDLMNNSLDNLEWKIRCRDGINFYPQPYYDKKGNITSKCCSYCGEIRDINQFELIKPKAEGHNYTYRNKCVPCMSKYQWNRIKSNDDEYARHLIKRNKFKNSEKGKVYHRQYNTYRYNKSSKEINDYYISKCLRVSKNELTPELREIYKKKVTLTRKLENHGNKEN